MTTTQHHTFAEELLAIISGLIGGAKYGVKIRLPHALVMTMLFRNDLSSKEKLQSILRLVVEHATNLGCFATIYKIILVSLKRASRYLRHHPTSERRLGRILLSLIVDGPFTKGTHSILVPPSMAGHPERPYHALVAGAVGGYYIWGRYSSVNYQIVLYLTSRVLIGVTKRIWEHYFHKDNSPEHGGKLVPSSSTQGGNSQGTGNILQHPQIYPIMAAAIWGLVMVLFEESPHVLHKSLRQSMDEIYRYQLSSYDSSVNDDDDSGSPNNGEDYSTNDKTNRMNLTI